MGEEKYIRIYQESSIRTRMELLTCTGKTLIEKLEFYNYFLKTETVRIEEYSKDIILIINEENIEKPMQPIIELPREKGNLTVIGSFLVGCNKENELRGFESVEGTRKILIQNKFRTRLVGFNKDN